MQSDLGLNISGLSVGSSTHDIRKTKGPDKKAVNDLAKLNGLQFNMQKCEILMTGRNDALDTVDLTGVVILVNITVKSLSTSPARKA